MAETFVKTVRKLCYSNRPVSLFRIGIGVLSLAILGFWGCTHPISEGLRRNVDPSITLSKLRQSAEPYLNKQVMFGGVIVDIHNFPDKTEIEVLQKELDFFGYPDRGDASEGRFIFVKEGFLDPEIYAKGRYVTGAGKIEGSRTGKIEDSEYRFPLVKVEELYLWEQFTQGPYYGPYYGHYYGPYFGPYYYGHGFRRYGYW